MPGGISSKLNCYDNFFYTYSYRGIYKYIHFNDVKVFIEQVFLCKL